MNSRDRFSLGAFAVLSLPSNQISRAGSTIMAWARSGKRPVAPARSRSFWATISGACRTFCTLVAKWPCQNQVSRSVSWSSARTIRSSHHTAAACWASRRSRLRCRRCWGSAFLPTRAASGSAGAGVAAVPGSASGGRCSRASSQAGQPADCSCASSPGRQPKPNRSAARRTSAASSSAGSGMAAMVEPAGRRGQRIGASLQRINRYPRWRIGQRIPLRDGAALATVDRPTGRPAPKGREVTAQLPQSVAAFVETVNAGDTIGFLDSFTPERRSSTTGAAGSATGRPSGPGATRSSSGPTGT